MNADGSGIKTLVRHDFRDDTYDPWDIGVGKPTWSPDGDYIAFEHLGDGDISPAQVFVMRSDGSDVRRLNVFPDRQFAESDPSWSPDGTRIVHWSYGFGIATTPRNGGSPNALFAAFPQVAYGSKPVFLPDGKTVAFNHGRFTVGVSSIWTVSGDWRSAKLLIANAYDGVWSPDGKRIAYVSTRE
jgi:Tol biopolymer transport system component